MIDFTPINLITGFLGAGKTTLLRRLLADPSLADTAVLINEFGEIGLDHHLLERIDETMVLLPSGCVCCSIRGELSAAIKALLSRRDRNEIPAFRRLLVESTGLADPFPILSTVQNDPVLKHHFRPGNVVTVIDAVNAADQLSRHSESVKQVVVADRLVLTKTDMVDIEAVELLLRDLRRLNPTAPLWRAAEEPLDAAVLLSHDLFALAGKSDRALQWFADEVAAGRSRIPDRHGERIRALAIDLEGEIDWTMFGIWLTMLLNRHGASVLRAKAILNVADSETPVAIHAVQHLVHPPVHMAAWPDEDRRSRMIFIVDGLDAGLIRRSLMAFLGHFDRRAGISTVAR